MTTIDEEVAARYLDAVQQQDTLLYDICVKTQELVQLTINSFPEDIKLNRFMAEFYASVMSNIEIFEREFFENDD